jgi:hypothetical protein
MHSQSGSGMDSFLYFIFQEGLRDSATSSRQSRDSAHGGVANGNASTTRSSSPPDPANRAKMPSSVNFTNAEVSHTSQGYHITCSKLIRLMQPMRGYFFKLPPELRNEIYKLAVCFEPTRFLKGCWDRRTFVLTPPPLAQTCRLLREEVIYIYFRYNRFYLQLPWQSSCSMEDVEKFQRQIAFAVANGSLRHITNLRIECGMHKRYPTPDPVFGDDGVPPRTVYLDISRKSTPEKLVRYQRPDASWKCVDSQGNLNIFQLVGKPLKEYHLNKLMHRRLFNLPHDTIYQRASLMAAFEDIHEALFGAEFHKVKNGHFDLATTGSLVGDFFQHCGMDARFRLRLGRAPPSDAGICAYHLFTTQHNFSHSEEVVRDRRSAQGPGCIWLTKSQ